MDRPSQEETDALLKPPITVDEPICRSCGLITYPAAWCPCPPSEQLFPFLELQILAISPEDEAFELARERAEAEYELLLR